MMKRKKNKKPSLLGRFFRLITYFFLVLLLLSYVAKFIPPDKIWVMAFLGIAFPYLYVLTIILALLWLIKRKQIAIYCVLATVISTFTAINFYRPFPKKLKAASEETNTFKVMSFNVRNFNFHNNWKDKNRYMRRDSIFSFIKTTTPDIVCFQEAYKDASGKYKTIDTLLTIQKAAYVHEYFPQSRKNHNFGIVTLSAFPIINREIIHFETGIKNACIFTDILIADDTIRVYNAHFASIGLSKEDFVFIETISSLNIETEKTEEIKLGFRAITKRLKNAFEIRADQVKTVSTHIESSPYPVILCTDLNDTPSSYAYRILRKNLKDAFAVSGKGIGNTYNGNLPYFRIDYIMHSGVFTSYNFTTHHNIDLSDHFPLTSLLILNN